jgi:hypothetical protein
MNERTATAAAPPPATAGSLAGAAHRMLVTTSAGHADRVAELANDVARFAALGDDSRLPEAVEAWQAGVDGLQLTGGESKGGWLARAGSKDREAREALAAQAVRFESERGAVQAEARELLARWEGQAGAARRMLVEFVVEVQALERTLVGVAKLLRDMKRALRKERAHAESGTAHLELAALEERAARVHARLRLYESVPRAAHDVHRLAQEITASRAALAREVQSELARHAERFQDRLQRLAGSTRPAGAAEGDGLELAEEARRNLQMWLTQAGATCIRLQHQEHQAARAIAKLRQRVAEAEAGPPQ